MITDLKKEIIDKISLMNDENLLRIIKEDIEYFGNEKNTNVLDKLSPEDLKDLKNILNEPFAHETESYEEYKKATDRWRTK